MNQNAKVWIEALRSDRFKQCKHNLHMHNDNGDSFCCLGVACKLAQEAGIELVCILQEYVTYYDNQHGTLPPIVQQWLGLRDNAGRIYKEHTSLTILNDEGATFSEIADFIEANQKELFVPDTEV